MFAPCMFGLELETNFVGGYMTEEQQRLLAAQIRAANRTTRAIRAIVRFFLVQLVFLTAAAILFVIGDLTVEDTFECAAYGAECGGQPAMRLLAGIVALVGVVISSRVAWAELALSDPGLEEDVMPKGILHAPEFKPGLEFKLGEGRASSPTRDYKCPNCSFVSEVGSEFCTSCGKSLSSRE